MYSYQCVFHFPHFPSQRIKINKIPWYVHVFSVFSNILHIQNERSCAAAFFPTTTGRFLQITSTILPGHRAQWRGKMFKTFNRQGSVKKNNFWVHGDVDEFLYHTVEGSEIPRPTTSDGAKNPVNNGINYLRTGAGFLPSTVVLPVWVGKIE